MEHASVPWPAQGLHVHLSFRDGALVATRLARAPGVDEPRSEAALAARDIVARHLESGREDFTRIPVDLSQLPPFHQEVLTAMRGVRAGRTVSYGELAAMVGRTKGAARAVGGACAANPIPLVVPCHRIVASGGLMGHYSGEGGLATKHALLVLEGARF